MYIGLHVQYPLYLSDFNETWLSSTDFWKIFKYQNFMKIHSVGDVWFHADRRKDGRPDTWTDVTKLITAFPKISKVLKNMSKIEQGVTYEECQTSHTYYMRYIVRKTLLKHVSVWQLLSIYRRLNVSPTNILKFDPASGKNYIVILLSNARTWEHRIMVFVLNNDQGKVTVNLCCCVT